MIWPRSQRPVFKIAKWAALALVLSTSACQPPGTGGRASDIGRGAVWPYWPTSMEITPLTRLITDPATQKPLLEARIEFLDVQGFTSRAVGLLHLEIRDGSKPLIEEPVQTKQRDLRNLAENQQHFDIVTRTYLFRLEVIPESWPDEPVLHVTFDSLDGQVLKTSRKVGR